MKPELTIPLTILTLFASATAQADIIVDVQNADISAGGTGFVDVLISSTVGAGENLDLASYDFQIANVGSPSSALQFATPQDLTEDTLGNYVFAGDNLGINQIALTPTQFTADDGTASFAGVNLNNTTRLLARLELEHSLGPGQSATDAAGDQFRITLQNSFDTGFFDFNVDPLNIDASSFDTNVGGGLLTVSAAAVPEPSSIAFLTLGGLTLAVRTRRQRKKSSQTTLPLIS